MQTNKCTHNLLKSQQYYTLLTLTCFGSHRPFIRNCMFVIWVRDLTVPMRLGFKWQAHCAQYWFMGALLLYWSSRWPPDMYFYKSFGSETKEPRYVCLSEVKASHSQKIWAEVSSSAPHILHNGLSDSPVRWRFLLSVLCPVRRPVTTLERVLLKDRNLALATKQGPEINSLACLGAQLHKIKF
jgi:hypothetical protein